MSTIVTSETVSVQVRGATTRYRFKYVLDTGDVLYRNAWVPSTTDEATERSSRGAMALVEEADAETARLLA